MSNTTIQVTLSAALVSELTDGGNGNGVYAAAVYFPTDDSAEWTSFVNDGTLAGSSDTFDISVPDATSGGKLYFLVQSLPAGAPASDIITNSVTVQSDVSWTTATNDDFSYDSFEYTLQNSADDVGNLTSVNAYGLPIGVVVPYANGTTKSIGYGISGTALTNDFADISPAVNTTYTGGALAGDFREAVSPTESTTTDNNLPSPPFKTSDWDAYVQSLEGAKASNIFLSGVFVGSKDSDGHYHNAGYYSYRLSWDGTYFWLDPIDSSQIQGDIRISPSELEESIYQTSGEVDIFTSETATTPFLKDMNTGANNQWGAILVDLFTGFSAGYFGTTGAAMNPQLTSTVNLDQNTNWSPYYAFGSHLADGTPAPDYYDPYSEIFFDNSNSYGSNYSDALMRQYDVGGPQISLYDNTTKADVSSVDLTIYAPSDTPTDASGTSTDRGTSQGYTPPQLYQYIKPALDGYAPPDTINPANNIVLYSSTQSDQTLGVALASDTPITLKILTSDLNNTPAWDIVTFGGDGQSIYQTWSISGNATDGYSITAVPDTSQATGTVVISGFPTPMNGISWYQLVIGEKTDNLYVTTSGGTFVNPGYALSVAGALAVDGMAAITTPISSDPTLTTFTVNLNTGSDASIDPSLLTPNTDQKTLTTGGMMTPDAPVAGSIGTGGSFTSVAGQSMELSNTITVNVNAIAFAWTVDNNDPNTPSWIEKYTNKIEALDIALIRIENVSTGDTLTTTATADIDGEWQTGSVDIPDGVYDVIMQSYLPSDTGFTTPLTLASGLLDLTVAFPGGGYVGIPCFAAGTRIATVSGEVAVDDLAVGDLVLTRSGAARPIVWIGFTQVDCLRHPKPENVWPIRIRAHAFGEAEPCRDLLLSPDHAVFVDGMLIPIRQLINGASIAQVETTKVTYFHIELERHDVLFAEGLPAESYLDTGNRAAFANGGTPTMLHPEFSDRDPRTRATHGCAPLVVGPDQVEPIWRRLAARAAAIAF